MHVCLGLARSGGSCLVKSKPGNLIPLVFASLISSFQLPQSDWTTSRGRGCYCCGHRFRSLFFQ